MQSFRTRSEVLRILSDPWEVSDSSKRRGASVSRVRGAVTVEDACIGLSLGKHVEDLVRRLGDVAVVLPVERCYCFLMKSSWMDSPRQVRNVVNDIFEFRIKRRKGRKREDGGYYLVVKLQIMSNEYRHWTKHASKRVFASRK